MDKWKLTSIVLMLLIIAAVLNYAVYTQVKSYQNEKKSCAQNISALTNYSTQVRADNVLYIDIINTCKTDAFITCAQGVLNNRTKG